MAYPSSMPPSRRTLFVLNALSRSVPDGALERRRQQ